MSEDYSYYDIFDDEEQYKCPQCKGTGMTRYEEDECLFCYGEGYIFPADFPDLTAPVYR